MPSAEGGGLVVLYDGVCGLCNGTVRFALKRDRRDVLRFAPLQSDFARGVLAKYHKDPDRLDTMYLIVGWKTPDELLLSRARAVLRILREVGWPWRALAILGVLPNAILDFLYNRVASIRYRVFGKYDTCPLPDPSSRRKFLALGDGLEAAI
jgi:predicted DCC family thiol-disulfide oxidoreductase YuxK